MARRALNLIRDQFTPLKMSALLLSIIPFYFLLIYVNAYGLKVPVHDQWYQSANVAYETKNHTLDVQDIVGASGGHRAVFTYLSTVFLTYTTHWNPIYETYLAIILAVLRLGVLILIFRECQNQLSFVILVPFSMVIFAIQQAPTWLSGIHTVWHFASLFSLLAIWTLLKFQIGWRSLLGAAFFAFCAAFSQGAGLVTFPILAVTLWMFGYRHWKYMLFWVAALVITLGLYFHNNSTSDANETIAVGNPIDLIRFVIIFIGNPFSTNLNLAVPLIFALTGIALFLLNVSYLWYKRSDWSILAPWFALAGITTAIAIMVYLTRYREGQFGFAVNARYILASTHFWTAVIATSVLAGWHLWQEKSPAGINLQWRRVLIPLNLVLHTLFLLLFLQANLSHAQDLAIGYSYNIGAGSYKYFEDCVRYAPVTHNRECFDGGNLRGPEDALYRIAYYGLSVFADAKPITILPEEYRADSPVILDTPTAWMNAYLRKWYLNDFDENRLFHIAPTPDDAVYTVQSLQEPLTNLFAGYDDAMTAALASFVRDANTVWYIRTRETADHEAQMQQILSSLGYLYTVVPLSDVQYNQELFLVRYDLAPENLENLAVFDEVISLQNWSIADPQSALTECQPFHLLTWWTAVESVPTVLYGLQAALFDSENTQLSIKASALTHVPQPFWNVQQLYVDERVIQVPCDLAPGQYRLAISVNNPELQDLAALQIQSPDLHQDGNWATLTTFTVLPD